MTPENQAIVVRLALVTNADLDEALTVAGMNPADVYGLAELASCDHPGAPTTPSADRPDGCVARHNCL